MKNYTTIPYIGSSEPGMQGSTGRGARSPEPPPDDARGLRRAAKRPMRCRAVRHDPGVRIERSGPFVLDGPGFALDARRFPATPLEG